MCYILIRQPKSGLSRKSTAECVESFGEPAGVRFLSLCQGFEPFGQFRQTLVPRSLGKTGIHFGVFIGFAFDGRFQVFRRSADGHARNRIADLFEEIEMPCPCINSQPPTSSAAMRSGAPTIKGGRAYQAVLLAVTMRVMIFRSYQLSAISYQLIKSKI